eukprot:364779-Chlamydomonas_euryale.AAC.24
MSVCIASHSVSQLTSERRYEHRGGRASAQGWGSGVPHIRGGRPTVVEPGSTRILTDPPVPRPPGPVPPTWRCTTRRGAATWLRCSRRSPRRPTSTSAMRTLARRCTWRLGRAMRCVHADAHDCHQRVPGHEPIARCMQFHQKPLPDRLPGAESSMDAAMGHTPSTYESTFAAEAHAQLRFPHQGACPASISSPAAVQEVVKLLLAHGVQLTAGAADDANALHFCAMKGHVLAGRASKTRRRVTMLGGGRDTHGQTRGRERQKLEAGRCGAGLAGERGGKGTLGHA